MLLSMIIKEYGLDIKATKLIRHACNRSDVREIIDKGYLEAYQNEQGGPIFDKCKHVLSFMSSNGTSAVFFGCYEVGQKYEGIEKKRKMPKGFPYPEYFEKSVYYDLKETDIMADLKNRLVIDWGKNTRRFDHWAETKKAVIAIYPEKGLRTVGGFKSYEETILSFKNLETIINDPLTYDDWYISLSNVNGIYLICVDGLDKQYIGSTYGNDGIWGRWKCYAETHDGGDEGIKKLLKQNENAYKNFRFTILKTLPKQVLPDDAIKVESLYKEKLRTRSDISSYGINEN